MDIVFGLIDLLICLVPILITMALSFFGIYFVFMKKPKNSKNNIKLKDQKEINN